MQFDIYGRFQVEVRRENDGWVAYRLAPGRRMPCSEMVIPASMTIDEIPTYLDDIYHELAGPGDEVTVIEP